MPRSNGSVYKKGVQTSEFWAVVAPMAATMLVAVLKTFGVDIDINATVNALLVIGPAAGAFYAACRTVLKIFRLKHASTIAVVENRADTGN